MHHRVSNARRYIALQPPHNTMALAHYSSDIRVEDRMARNRGMQRQ